MKFHLLQHVHGLAEGAEDVKIIGVYSSRENAEAAIKRMSQKPGFCDAASGFHVDEYQIVHDQWIEGYSMLANA